MVPEHQVDEAATAILEYLAEHPNAADTLEGIIVWWLARTRYLEARPVVERALDQLLVKGTLHRHKIRGSEAIYRLERH